MSYYTDKVYSSNFLSKSRGLDEMLVQDTVEERPPLPESRQARLEARLKETTARDTTSFSVTKREPRETVLYLGPSRGTESHVEVRDTRELRERKRKEESMATISSRSNRSLLEESRRSTSNLNRDYSSKTRDTEQNHERYHRPMSMSRTEPSSSQRFGFKEESPLRPSSALGAYSSYNTRRSLAPEGLERRREETKAPLASTYSSSSRTGRRGEERDWLPSSSSSRLLVRGDQRSGVEIFSHTGGSAALTNVR